MAINVHAHFGCGLPLTCMMASNGKKKGFIRLSNEDIVAMNDSGSEVELLDVTQLEIHAGQKHGKKKR